MQIRAQYSHLNGWEFLQVHKLALWREIATAIEQVDAFACKTKISREKTMRGRELYSPTALNQAFKSELSCLGWSERRSEFWVTSDERVLRGTYQFPSDEQRRRIEDAGLEAIYTYNQTDFVKERVSIEVQFGKYSFVAHDLFVKHLSFYVSDVVDVGIEILPMKEMEREMSSGVPYYERDLLNVIRQGRGVPAVPLVILGVIP